MGTLVALTISLLRDDPPFAWTLAAAPLDMEIASVNVCDLPEITDTDGSVTQIPLTGLFEGHEPFTALIAEDPDALVDVLTEVLRVVSAGALAARRLQPAEITDWESVARQILHAASNQGR
jgi:hypothetical protein